MKRSKVTTRCVADRYSGPNERIIEFSSEHDGGLINFVLEEDSKLRVSVYQEDETVRAQVKPNQFVLKRVFDQCVARAGRPSEHWKWQLRGELIAETRDDALEAVYLVRKALPHFVGGGRVDFEEIVGHFHVEYETKGHHALIDA